MFFPNKRGSRRLDCWAPRKKVTSEPEIEASENIDINPSDNTEQKSEEPSANQTEEKEPSIKRDDDEGDKIKFKR